MISFKDIITSAIQPLISTFVGSVAGVVLASLITPKPKKKVIVEDGETKEEKTHTKGQMFFILLLFLGCIGALILLKHYIPIFNFQTLAFIIGMLVNGLLNEDWVFDKQYQPKISKDVIVMVMVLFPLLSAGIALDRANEISSNKFYYYITSENHSTNSTTLDTMKLIGESEKTFIFTDMKNKKTLFLKKDSLVLYRK